MNFINVLPAQSFQNSSKDMESAKSESMDALGLLDFAAVLGDLRLSNSMEGQTSV